MSMQRCCVCRALVRRNASHAMDHPILSEPIQNRKQQQGTPLPLALTTHGHRASSTEQLLDVLNALQLLLLIRHHPKRRRTASVSLSFPPMRRPTTCLTSKDCNKGHSHELLPVLDLEHLLLHAALDNKPVHLDILVLAHAVHAVNGLRLHREAPPRIHHVHALGRR